MYKVKSNYTLIFEEIKIIISLNFKLKIIQYNNIFYKLKLLYIGNNVKNTRKNNREARYIYKKQ